MAYVVTGFLINPDWSQVLWSTIIPTLPKGHAMWGTLVAILGTTISPYLFYWQSSQEVEEEKSKGRKKIWIGAERAAKKSWIASSMSAAVLSPRIS